MVFSELLSIYRNTHQLTQEQMVQKIKDHSSDFDTLDAVTYSRWENSKTIPFIRRQVKIAIILNLKSEIKDLVRVFYSDKDQKIANFFDKMYEKSYGVSESPYINDKINILEKKADLNDSFNSFSSFQKRIYGGDLLTEISYFDNLNFYRYYNLSDLFVGHAIYAVCQFSEFARYSTDLSFNINRGYLEYDDAKVIYFVSEYSIHKDMTVYKYNHVYNLFIEKDIDYLIIRCYHKEGMRSCEYFDGEIYALGPEKENGLRLNNKKYLWICYIVPIENYLSAGLIEM